MKKFNLIYKGIVLNTKPMSIEQAKYESGLIIISYGYRPTIQPIG